MLYNILKKLSIRIKGGIALAGINKYGYYIKDNKLINRINNQILNNEDLIKIKKAFNKLDLKLIKRLGGKEETTTLLTQIYIMLNIFKMTNSDIGQVYNKSRVQIYRLLNKIDWNLDKEESQARAALKRDYESINIKARKTRLQEICGSKSEEYVRHMLYLHLKNTFSDSEIIVGINSINYIENLECDIPIHIIHKDKLFKFAVEFNGDYYHKNKHEFDNYKKEIFQKHKLNVIIQTQQKNQTSEKKLNKIVRKISKQIQNIIKEGKYATENSNDR